MAAQSDEHKQSPLKAWVRALERTAPIGRDRFLTLPALIGQLGERFGAAPALIGPDCAFTYRSLSEAANRYARWGLSRGLSSADVVCLLMENRPEYLAIWLGLTGIGVTVALVNTNLSARPLLHSLRTVDPSYVICSSRCADALLAVRAHLAPQVQCWVHGERAAPLPRLDAAAASFAGEALAASEYRAPSLEARALCIYTSGTTGLPKAANVSHFRLMQWSHWFAGLMDVRPEDRMYDCLPLYHSVGGVVATGAALVGGAAVVLRERFSASTFWHDVCAERCTLFQYIGELCRYLLLAPPRPEERQHGLRLACGNGLRAEVWQAFQTRFAIPQILEYYAATEGNFSLYNCEGRPGAIGRIPPFLAHRVPVAVVKFDLETGAPERDANGRCQRCAVDEVGEALGQILQPQAQTRFEGYTDTEASAKKILRDVFAPGDAWYRTGDLMRQDAQGFFYFIDRIGDTFRWKGENVSTTEVAAVISDCTGVREVAVYGVAVPHYDGRTGMAALVVDERFELAALYRYILAQLPAYACPVFLRITSALELTGTFKLRKHELALEGYDVARITDALYMSDASGAAYVPLDAQRYERLMSGAIRL